MEYDFFVESVLLIEHLLDYNFMYNLFNLINLNRKFF